MNKILLVQYLYFKYVETEARMQKTKNKHKNKTHK